MPPKLVPNPKRNLPTAPPVVVTRPRPQDASFSWTIDPLIVFYVFFTANLLATIFSPIQDCDETFNYWEPTHYLNHGYGLQTWEYSPDYAIRSWLYTGIHAIPIYLGSWIPLIRSKRLEFYFLRLVFATGCAVCETQLYATVARSMNPRISLFFLLALVSSAGMFHAAVAYLPSAFAMYTVFLALGMFMNRRGGARTAGGLTWLAIGAIVGWPFVGLMCVPFVFEEATTAWVTHDAMYLMWKIIWTSTRSFTIVAFQISIDWFFYKFVTCVPLNMVLYNVFSDSNRGPNLYGTEPWHFYLRNLLINFNVWFLLALASGPLLYLQRRYGRQAASRMTFFRSAVFLSPFYIWLAVFSLQPHKEERFMYPLYPCLALNAALALHLCILYLSTSDARTLAGRIPAGVKFAVISTLILSAITLGLLRAVGVATAYSAPLRVYAALQQHVDRSPAISGTAPVCVGKEWYRFPSSYHLPAAARLKFVESDFAGLLPGEFSESAIGFGMFPGTWLPPSGMNDRNEPDPEKLYPVERCAFLIDARFPAAEDAEASALEPDYAADADVWERIVCEPFLDAARTGVVGRLFWVPEWKSVPRSFRRQWGEYCLLRRK